MTGIWSGISDYFWPPPPEAPSLGERLQDNANFCKSLGLTDDVEYPFENLVLEGGGAKGIAYAGVIKVLEKAGIWRKLKRYAGTSAGAIVACLLVVGYTPDELLDILATTDMESLTVDDPSTFMAIMKSGCRCYNLFKYFGWNSGNKMLKWLGDKIEHKTGDKDLTFKKLFKKTGKELCIVVTNVSLMTEEYFHVKTTPDIPIRTAVRMSMSIPVYFQAVKRSTDPGEDVYVDGGMLVNYPIKCFDGWWLSMKIKDNFLTKLQPLTQLAMISHRKDIFGITNNKTLGVLLYAKGAEGVFNSNITLEDPIRPDTKLAREQTDREKRYTSNEMENGEEKKILEAYNMLVTRLTEKLEASGSLDAVTINKECFLEVIQDIKDDPSESEKAELLFGENWDVSSTLDKLQFDEENEITFSTLVKFAQKLGYDGKSIFYGHSRKEMSGFRSYLGRLVSMMLTNTQRLHFEAHDLIRSVFVNVDYIGTLDFDMEIKDKEFAVTQGAVAMKRYLEMKQAQTKDANVNAD